MKLEAKKTYIETKEYRILPNSLQHHRQHQLHSQYFDLLTSSFGHPLQFPVYPYPLNLKSSTTLADSFILIPILPNTHINEMALDAKWPSNHYILQFSASIQLG